MNKPSPATFTIKARGYFAQSRPDGKVVVKGRGPRRVMTLEEFAALLQPKPKTA
ncbi:hypothetical protein [Achromobacter sp. NFACC18-2]|uniref:hypothetical protein n=1 Tax=Achromobacter sp. NFACC18-2 TaxID=1564112 RepID=UPI0008BC6DDF|nr:hypothetical protein [Achromobacter sp. NFACC18-2]SEJ84891.1 hypothetical protein SAMN03159494_03563 [Achromobacter sp. NFACC18-2]